MTSRFDLAALLALTALAACGPGIKPATPAPAPARSDPELQRRLEELAEPVRGRPAQQGRAADDHHER